MDPEWFNVNEDAQIWSGHADIHKQFVLRAPAGILAMDEYRGSYQFKTMMINDGEGNLIRVAPPLDAGYPETWIRIVDVTTELYEEDDGNGDDPPPPEEEDPPPITQLPGDGELGAALRILGRFIFNIIHGISQ